MRHIQIQRLKDGVVHVDLGAAEWSQLVPRLSEAWPVVAAAVEEFLQARPTWEWDRLRAYARFDSGIVWFSPDPQHPRRNANVAGIEMACLDRLYHELPSGGDGSAAVAAFERAHQEMDRRVFEALRHSALLPAPRVALAALQRLRAHPVTFVQYDDLETERTLIEPAELRGAG